MSKQPSTPGAGPTWPGLELTPTWPDDPVKVGDFWLDGRVVTRPSGVAWAAHGDGLLHPTRQEETDPDHKVILVQLSEGAAADKAARDRFAGLVNQLHIDVVLARGGHEQDQGRLGRRFRNEDDDPVDPDEDHPLAPWVALAYAGDDGLVRLADDLLAQVDLLDLPHLGRPAGPDFRLHWIDRNRPGTNRIWPLPWPGRYDRAGWVTILVSWLLMLLMAAIAVIIAILVFRNAPPQAPPPQAGQTASPGGTGSATATLSPSPGGTPTATSSPSPSPGDTPSGGGTPTPPSRL
ncbi:hypothetical protein AADG42_13115 [Ammonicoccus fulvus]|uniref:Uncharacterized protein n=1 Tax=Ammonicoccus fulvus TaxID=3138240 RepID=A0ABZ3FQ67_9ACTN